MEERQRGILKRGLVSVGVGFKGLLQRGKRNVEERRWRGA